MSSLYHYIGQLDEIIAKNAKLSKNEIQSAFASSIYDLKNKRADWILKNIIYANKWSDEFINDLPDSSFAVVEDGGRKDTSGKTTPRNYRHLPYKDASGKVDLAHLRNALATVNLIQVVSTSDSTTRIRKVAQETLSKIAQKTIYKKPSKSELMELVKAVSNGRFKVTTSGAGMANHTHDVDVKWDEKASHFVGRTVKTHGDTDHVHLIQWAISLDDLGLANKKEYVFSTEFYEGHSHIVTIRLSGDTDFPLEPNVQDGIIMDRNLTQEGLDSRKVQDPTVKNSPALAEFVDLFRLNKKS